MSVGTVDPDALPIGDIFAQAMAGPNKPRDVPSPGDVDPDAPHGRDAEGNPLAPFGWTKPTSKNDTPRPKLTSGGRKAKIDQARVASDPGPAASAGKSSVSHAETAKPKLEPRDYAGPLAETSEAIWVGLTMLSDVPLEKTPIIGRIPVGKGKVLGDYLAGLNRKLAAQAHIFNANRGGLVQALNVAANNSARARRLCDKLEAGDATWVLMCGAMVMPFMSQTASLWTNSLEADGLPALAKLAEANKASMDSWIAKFNSQLEALTAEAAEALTEAA